MRGLTNKEMAKRGCVYCTDMVKKKIEPDAIAPNKVCIHDECPYHELDPYDTYRDFLKSPGQNKAKIALDKLFNIERHTK